MDRNSYVAYLQKFSIGRLNPILSTGLLFSYRKTFLAMSSLVLLGNIIYALPGYDYWVYHAFNAAGLFVSVGFISLALILTMFMRGIIRSFVGVIDSELLDKVFIRKEIADGFRSYALRSTFGWNRGLTVLFVFISLIAYIGYFTDLLQGGYSKLLEDLGWVGNRWFGHCGVWGQFITQTIWFLSVFFILAAIKMFWGMYRAVKRFKSLRGEYALTRLTNQLEALAEEGKLALENFPVDSHYINFKELAKRFAKFYFSLGFLFIVVSTLSVGTFTFNYWWSVTHGAAWGEFSDFWLFYSGAAVLILVGLAIIFYPMLFFWRILKIHKIRISFILQNLYESQLFRYIARVENISEYDPQIAILYKMLIFFENISTSVISVSDTIKAIGISILSIVVAGISSLI